MDDMSNMEDIPLHNISAAVGYSTNSCEENMANEFEMLVTNPKLTEDIENGYDSDEKDETDGGNDFNSQIKKKFKIYAESVVFASTSKRSHTELEEKGETQDSVKPPTSSLHPSTSLPTLMPTDAYGQLEFLKGSRKTRARYIRLADNTNLDEIIELFSSKWELPLNKLQMLISIVGCHNQSSFKLKSKIQSCLTQGLRKIANVIQPWIVTGGTDGGIHRFLGQILQGYKYNETVLLGITTWNIVKGRESLKRNRFMETETIRYPPVDPIDEQHVKTNRSDELQLNEDHSHFILVDFPETGNKQQSCFKESVFRANFENRLICELQSISHERYIFQEEKNEEGPFKPAIQIVVNGGCETIEHVHSNLMMDNMDVIVMAESGGAADLLAKSCVLFDECSDDLYGSFQRLITKEIERVNWDHPVDPQHLVKLIGECMQRKENITIFYSNKKKTLDEIILYRLLDRPKNEDDYTSQLQVDKHFFERLKWASIWNRADIAKKKLFQGVGFASHPSELEGFMCDELAKNKVKTVELLLESGFDIKSIDYYKLGQLYYKKCFEEGSWLAHFVDKKKVTQYENELQRYRNEIDQKRSSHVRRKQKVIDWPKFINLELIKKSLIKLCGLNLFPKDIKKGYIGLEKLSHPFTELFIWAVFCNMHEMALMLWEKGDEVLAKALIARKMYIEMKKVYQKRLSYVDEAALERLQDNADKFGNLALGILDECSNADKNKTESLLFKPFHKKSDITCWKLAASSVFQEFMAHPVCQNVVMKRWNGDLKFYGKYHSYEVFMAVIFFPLLFNLNFRFERKKTNRMTESKYSFLKNQCEKMKIFYSAPITKFFLNVLAYVAFLCLFIFVLQTKFTMTPSIAEWLIVVNVIALTSEEIRQIVHSNGILLGQRIRSWWDKTWNKMDMVAIILFYIGFAFRISQNAMLLEIGRVLYTLDLMVWIMRLLDFFAVNKKLGPYVVMIKKMTEDVFYFLVIFLVFWLAYGIARSVILESNEAFTFDDLRHFIIPYFQMYGEMYVNPMETDRNLTMFGTTKHNSYNEGIMIIMMIIYVLFTNLLLVNLLIAVFNNTYSNVQANSKIVWMWQWYSLVEEYMERPILVPPFVILSHLSSFVTFMWKFYKCDNKYTKDSSNEKASNAKSGLKMKQIQEDGDDQFAYVLMQFEEDCQQSYLFQQNALLSGNEKIFEEMKRRTGGVEKIMKNVALELTQVNKTVLKLSTDIHLAMQRLTKLEIAQNRRRSVTSVPVTPQVKRITPIGKKSFNFLRLASIDQTAASRKVESYAHQPVKISRSFPYDKVLGNLQDAQASGHSSENEDINVVSKTSSQSSLHENVGLSNNIEEEVSSQHILPLQPEEEELGENEYGFVHVLSRCSRYPFSDVRRFYFPDEFVDWSIPFPWNFTYDPKEYTSPLIESLLVETDSEEVSSTSPIKYNEIDGGINRTSFCGMYQVIDGKPRNPMGRTGITGRGCLKRFGPNHILEIIITRRAQHSAVHPVFKSALYYSDYYDFYELLQSLPKG